MSEDNGRWEGDFYVVPRKWPRTLANWRRFKLAFAGRLHAWADHIEVSDHDKFMMTVRMQNERKR